MAFTTGTGFGCLASWILAGGVCVYIKKNIPCKRLVKREEEEVESIWVQLRPHSLPRNISIILLGVVYHSTANSEAENVALCDHIQRNMDLYLSNHPNAMVIKTGDFNPTLTGLRSDSISRPNHLKQIVQFNTRDSRILDWFFTNRPHTFGLQRLPKLASSDHYTVLARSTVKHLPQHDSIQKANNNEKDKDSK